MVVLWCPGDPGGCLGCGVTGLRALGWSLSLQSEGSDQRAAGAEKYFLIIRQAACKEMLGGSSARQEHKPQVCSVSGQEDHRGNPPPCSALLCLCRIRRFCSEWDTCGAQGLWRAGPAVQAVLGCPHERAAPSTAPSLPAQPACPGFRVVPPTRAMGRTEIQLVLLIGGVTGLARVRPSAAALGNFCFRTKPLCWLGELEPRQGGSLKDFCP